jgi:hypothetical protein
MDEIQPYLDMWHSLGGSKILLLPIIALAIVQLYKLDLVQFWVAKLAPQLTWEKLPMKYQMLHAFLLGGLTAFLTALTKMPWYFALGAGVTAGILAVLAFKPLKSAAQSNLVSNSMAKLPSPLTKLAAPMLELDAERIKLLRKLQKDGQVK